MKGISELKSVSSTGETCCIGRRSDLKQRPQITFLSNRYSIGQKPLEYSWCNRWSRTDRKMSKTSKCDD